MLRKPVFLRRFCIYIEIIKIIRDRIYKSRNGSTNVSRYVFHKDNSIRYLACKKEINSGSLPLKRTALPFTK